MRLSSILALLTALPGCARQAAERTAGGVCFSPAPGGVLRTDTTGSQTAVLRGRLAWDGLRPSTPVRVALTRPGWSRTVSVAADTFYFTDVALGVYELRTMMWGQRPRMDTLQVPSAGLSVLVPFASTLVFDDCGGNTSTVRAER
jgi:hypothetical protein